MSLRTTMQRTSQLAGRRFASTAPLPKAPVPVCAWMFSFLNLNSIYRWFECDDAEYVLPNNPAPCVLSSQEVLSEYSFKKAFLSDPACYPLIVIMTFTSSFLIGFSINGMRYKNVKINPSKKHETIPTWDADRKASVTEVYTRRPWGFHRQGFKDIRQEGLGVNHEEWKKSKDAYYNTN